MIKKFATVILMICLLSNLVFSNTNNSKEITLTPEKGKDFTEVIYKFLSDNKTEEIIINFEKGTYDFYPEMAFEKYLKIANNDNGTKRIAFPLIGYKKVEINGNGATFLFHGGIIPFDLEEGENYSFNNFNIDWDKPFTFEGMVVANSKTDKTFDIEVTPGNNYEIIGDKLYFKGYDWKLALGENIFFESKAKRPAYFTAKYDYNWKKYPLSAKEIKKGVVRFSNVRSKEVPPIGTVFVDKGPHGENRRYPAFRISNMRNLNFKNINVYRAGAMALITEKSENITLDNFNVKLSPDTKQMISASADATHFVNCKGLVKFDNCTFENMLDDATNVHGTYVVVNKKIGVNQVGVNTKHYQQDGFEFASKGDSVRFIRKGNLLPLQSAVVTAINYVNESYYVITLDQPLKESIDNNSAIENLTWTASVDMKNCIVQQNRARGILISTPGNVLIENNYFSPMMAAIRICGDANYWFESGNVKNVVIRNNTFVELGIGGNNPQAILQIDPIIRKEFRNDGYFHRNIIFENNNIKTFDALIVYALSVDGLVIRNNNITQTQDLKPFFGELPQFDIQNSRNITIEGNTYNGKVPAKISLIESKNVKISKQKGFQKDSVQEPNKYFYQN
jgi:hypothetical protein